MYELSWDSLKTTVMKGILPLDITVQVITSKKISTDEGPESRYRLMLWDGDTVFKNALLLSSTLPLPDKHSIIRIGTDTLPADSKESAIRKMTKGDQESFAYMFHHYELVKEGSTVNTKLTRPTTPRLQGQGKGGNPPLSTPPNSGRPTDAAPQIRPRLGQAAAAASGSTNREAVKRNLEESFPSPKRQNTGGATNNNTAPDRKGGSRGGDGGGVEATHKVAAVNPHMNRFTLKVRVSQKRGIREISNSRWQGKVISCVLSDSSGDIQISAFNTEAETLNESIENDKSYLITGASVKPVRDTRYNTTGHNFELGWTVQTRVTGPLIAERVGVNYNFTNIANIKDLAADKSCDVCAFVQETGDLVEFRSRADRDLKKREITLADDSDGGSSITLTLWDKMAVNFKDQSKVITLKGAKVGEWNNVKNLSMGFTGSYEVEPDHPRVHDLVEWSSQLHPTQSQAPSQLNNLSLSGSEDFTTIQELKDELMAHKGEKRCRLFGYAVKINSENLFYRAHTPPDGSRCWKKVSESSKKGLYECGKCGKRNIPKCDTTLKYNVRLNVADFSSNNWCNMFDAVSLFNKDAEEMHELMNQDIDLYEKQISSRTMIPMVFKVSAKIETYNDSPRLKVIVHEVNELNWTGREEGKVDWKDVVRHQIAEVHAIESQLGVAHDIEVGTTWGDSIDI